MVTTNRAERRRGLRQEALDAAEQTAARAAEQAVKQGDSAIPNEIVLMNGIRFRFHSVPPLLIRKAARNVPRPVVPVVWLADKEREEENPNDPEYMAAMDEYFEASGLAALDAVIMVGLELIDVPEGFDRPEDEGWIRRLNAIGIDTNWESLERRFLEWTKNVALADVTDYIRLQTIVTRLMGVNEGDVLAAIESFRGNGERPTDNGASATPDDSNGNRVQRNGNGAST